ncbi:MAG: DUF4142 domain-containing protein [Sphingomonadaceae bacterium]|nr:DUF4142 domain-containing protein [Sphingomonadaceae bacterium]
MKKIALTLMLGVAPIALAACGHKTDTSMTTTDNTVMTTDNMAVPPGEDANMMDNGAMAMAPMASTDFVTKAAMTDMYEIAASKLAATHASSPDVKKFATEMIAAHTATTAGLKAAIAKGKVDAAPPAALDAEHKAMIDALTAVHGAQFDALYRSQQTDAHTKALGVMQGYASGGDNDALKAFAADTAPKVQSHLDMLKAMP